MSLNLSEFKRFEKQIILKKIGISGQNKIKKSKVLIIGMGGLGCPLLTYLAAAGIYNIGIADHDKVDVSNLNRQILFNTADLGKYKVIQAKSKINKIYKKIKIKTFNQQVSTFNINKISKDYDIICDGTDNFNTRYIINDHCKKNKKILISAAISRFDGQLFKFNFKKKGPCFRCFMPEKPIQENNCETEGIFSPVAGILGSLQANEVLKTILELKDDLDNNCLILNSLKMTLRKIKINVNSDCLNKCR
ncbi:HesA/MoeB/ThiF family protein [Pelagibacteraceae bacterium]|jgi:molybdopterin-synthase adenylyltransferase|nr:HesA/MoeB/ThiF family protein [Pelagibacteraceae bacterium]